MFKDKWIAFKEKLAREKRPRRYQETSRKRLPPGQHHVVKWPVLDLGIVPKIPLERWELIIDGLVEKPTRLTWDEFRRLPTVTINSDIHCVTSWSLYDNDWEGVRSRDVIDLVKVKPQASHVLFSSYDDYTTNVDLTVFQDEDVLLAFVRNQEPISVEHGGPLRVVIPKRYFWKSAKWIHRIHFSATDQPGFWEVRGYHNQGDPWQEERYQERGV